MPIALLDLIVIGIVLISSLLASVRGFTREILAIASWVTAAIASLYLHPYVLPHLEPYISNPTIAQVASIASVFIITLVLVSFVTVQISDLILDSRIGAVDRSLGFVFGAARGILICAIALVFFNWLVKPDAQPEWAQDAKSRPLLQSTGDQLLALLPADFGNALLQKVAPHKQGEDAAPADTDPGHRPSPVNDPIQQLIGGAGKSP